MSRITQRNKRKNKKKRKSNKSGSSSDKRQRLSDDASEIIESEESEASPENYAGETKESDSDRRGREQEERKQKKTEEAAERKRQGHANQAKSNTKLCIANIGGKRVEKNGIITFEGGETFGPYSSKQEAEDNTGILKGAIGKNIQKNRKSRGKKGIFKDQQVMFINAPVDTSNRVHCEHCNKHYGSRDAMIRHVRAKHPEVPLPPVAEITRMPEEFKTFTPPITQKQYSFIVRRVGHNIESDLKKCDQKQLMAMVGDFAEPWPSKNIGGAADKYNLTEQQILDSIANNSTLRNTSSIHCFLFGPFSKRFTSLKRDNTILLYSFTANVRNARFGFTC